MNSEKSFSGKKKDTEMSKSFCIRPFMHLATRTHGDALPCCVGKSFKTLQLNKNTFSEVWRSKEINEIRRKMLSNELVDLCKTCYDEEKSGVASHRIRSNKYWEKIISQKDVVQNISETGDYRGPVLSLDLRIGNTCNLACTMCNPNESTLWNRQMTQIQENLLPFYFKNPIKGLSAYLSSQVLNSRASLMKWHEREELWEDLKRHLPHVKEIVMGGGEPFLIPSQGRIVQECIEKGYAKNIELYYHTNGTLIKREFFEKWKHFKKVMLFISLDGVGEKNRYIRYPADWKKLVENLEIVDKESPDNIESMILCTVQIKNMYYLPEFCEWIKNQKFKKVQAYYEDLIYTGLVHNPPYLSIQVYPDFVKEKITKNFQQLLKIYGAKANRFQDLVAFMNQKDKSKYLEWFKCYVKALDQARNTSFNETFPELAEDLGVDH